jgi:2-polyprenyl-3-methyl-5-hydroxy-6-metoxy-1,4-benzoquinol methylase
MLRIRLISNILKILITIQNRIYGKQFQKGRSLSAKEQISRIVSSTNYNMGEEPNEQHYLEEYFFHIEKHLPKIGELINPKILDLGCGQGRFIEHFLKVFPKANITGIDISEKVISYNNQRYAENDKIKFILGNYSDYLDGFPDDLFDIVVFTEVAFFFPEWKSDFAKVLNKLKPNGLLIFSTRSSYFNVLSQISIGNFLDASRISNSDEGNIALSDPMHFSWNSSMELISFFESQNSSILSISGIGVCSGIDGDPMARIVIPGEINVHDREILKSIENNFATMVPDAGRYILVISTKY